MAINEIILFFPSDKCCDPESLPEALISLGIGPLPFLGQAQSSLLSASWYALHNCTLPFYLSSILFLLKSMVKLSLNTLGYEFTHESSESLLVNRKIICSLWLISIFSFILTKQRLQVEPNLICAGKSSILGKKPRPPNLVYAEHFTSHHQNKFQSLWSRLS